LIRTIKQVRFWSWEKMKLDFLWSDSMGAKSASTWVETEDTSVLIDPGAAEMQPSFPMSDEKKSDLRGEARSTINGKGVVSDHMVITHYHYDHHFLPDFAGFDFEKMFSDSEIWVKDPNKWINKSQWGRSRKFIKSLCETVGGEDFEDLKISPEDDSFKDPVSDLTHAMGKDFGDYQDRREELLEKWSKRMDSWQELWKGNDWLKEPELSTSVTYADGKSFEDGDTKVKFSKPLFHGIEYSKTGWVLSTVIEDPTGKTFLHSSDLQGPTIEDQADWIISEDPDYLFLDGPATYLYGYLLNKTNLERSVENAVRILRECDMEMMVYDHHLAREKKFRERTEKFWNIADESETEVFTVAESKNQTPKVLEVTG